MNLTKTLKNQDYDLIDGPVRNHDLLQLWLKKKFNEPELYYANIGSAFVSDVKLNEIENKALDVNTDVKNEYHFNIGISLLEDRLRFLDLTHIDLSSKLKSGKKVTISYSNSITKEVPVGEIEDYLSVADFKYANNTLLRNANEDRIILISGVLYAKNMLVEIETDFSLHPDLIANLNKSCVGKIDFSATTENKLKMTFSSNDYLPIAIKADRISFEKGHFRSTTLVTGSKQLF